MISSGRIGPPILLLIIFDWLIMPLLILSTDGTNRKELFANQRVPIEGSSDDEARSDLVTAKDLPDFWRQETDAQSIQQKRDKLMEESLGMKKYERMREALKAMREQQKGEEGTAKTPKNVLLEVELMQQVNRVGSQPSNSPNFVPPNSVPALHRVNAPISDLLFQGDMLLNEHQVNDLLGTGDEEHGPEGDGGEHLHRPKAKSESNRRRRRRRQVQTGKMYPMDKWTISQPIAYRFEASISENTRRLVRMAAQFWQNNTCLSFQEDGTWSPRVRIFKGQGCYSQIGRDIFAKEQEMSLGTGCELFGTITHEFGHVLGMFHHHSRQDRDANIQVIQENIEPDWRAQYRKETPDQSDLEGIEYNYGSNMHYGATGSDSEKVIMAAKHKRYQHTMGNNIGPVFLVPNLECLLMKFLIQLFSYLPDLLTINKYYKCTDKCPSGADCKNDGFRNPRNCLKCICPEGFGGDECDQRAPGEFGAAPDCGETVTAGDEAAELKGSVTPKLEPGRLLSDRHIVCHYHIEAPSGSRIQLELKSLNGTCTPECYFGAVEIKLGDFDKGGIRVCCEKHIAELGDKLVTEGERAIVSVYSQRGERAFALTHKITSDAATTDDDLLGGNPSNGGGSSASSSSSLSNLINALGGGSAGGDGSCRDKNTICTTMGSVICRWPFYRNIRPACQKSCGLC